MFLENVVRCLAPSVKKIFEMPKFIDDNTDAKGVGELVLKKIATSKKQSLDPCSNVQRPIGTDTPTNSQEQLSDDTALDSKRQRPPEPSFDVKRPANLQEQLSADTALDSKRQRPPEPSFDVKRPDTPANSQEQLSDDAAPNSKRQRPPDLSSDVKRPLGADKATDAALVTKKKRKKRRKKPATKNKTKTHRKLTPDLDNLLKELSSMWRVAIRSNDRETADRVLQIALKAIPRRTGRVSDWLGPDYFNEEDVPLVIGSRVRVLCPHDHAGFRNRYKYSQLIKGTVRLVGEEFVEVEVNENFGLRVVIRGEDGNERVLRSSELRQCEYNPIVVKDPYSARLHRKWNRKQVQRLQVGTIIEYRPTSKSKWVSTRVMRVLRTGDMRRMVYTISKHRVLHSDSVKLSADVIKRARRDNKLWGANLRPPAATVTERHIISAKTFNHLRDFIFSTNFLEPLKASEQATQRGHCFAVREAASTTFKRYRQDASNKYLSLIHI